MNPSDVISWAVCLGIAWLILASLTGVDEWIKTRFGTSKLTTLEERIAKLERRLDELGTK
jgi:hypothetical protein